MKVHKLHRAGFNTSINHPAKVMQACFCPNCDEICVNEFKINLNFQARQKAQIYLCQSKVEAKKSSPFLNFQGLQFSKLAQSWRWHREEKKLLMDGNVEDFQHILLGKYLSPPTWAQFPSIEVKLSVAAEKWVESFSLTSLDPFTANTFQFTPLQYLSHFPFDLFLKQCFAADKTLCSSFACTSDVGSRRNFCSTSRCIRP